MSLSLTKLAETNDTLTLGWDAYACDGFRFSREKGLKPDGTVRYSDTWNGTRRQVVFSKDSAWYAVEPLHLDTPARYPAVVTPPSADGRVVMDGRYEATPWPPPSSWSGAGSKPNPGHWDYLQTQSGATIALFDDPAGKSARLTNPANSSNSVELIDECTTDADGSTISALGLLDYYGMRYRFASPRVDSGWGAMIAQLHYPVLLYHSWGLVEQTDYVRCALNTGQISWSGTPGSSTGSFECVRNYAAIPKERFSTGKWHYLICGIRWATDWTGSTEIWHRIQGETAWTKTVDVHGIPTQQWGNGILVNDPLWKRMNKDGTFADGKTPFRPIDKFGLYSGETFENGGFVRATSFAAAEAVLKPI